MTRTATGRQSPPQASLPKPGRFEQSKSLPVVVNFNGGQVTSDTGVSLIAELDRKLKITSRLAGCFQDYRQVNRIDRSYRKLNCTTDIRINHGIRRFERP
ncbi:MAG: transposase [Nostoc sp.]